ncbi:MAG: DUF2075 domain-containing protein [Parafannyhessea sp.]|uniref:DUF2075 domain-containing protein n=1 Tax=Parafannyhessea sp. TaxID=2847324 RepID=UPI003EFD1A1F
MKLASPVIVDVPFHEEDRLIGEAIDDVDSQIDDRELTPDGRELLKTYPTVYIIRGKRHRKAKSDFEFDEYLLYVGETNSIVRRTKEHYSDEKTYRSKAARDAWKRLNGAGSRMLVIGQDHFNKSLTLDLENTFLSYLLASDARRVTLVNGRGNPQDDYYTKADLPAITSAVWRRLNRYEPQLFPAESVIRDSAIFKASPFHALGPEQLVAEDKIIARLRQTLGNAGATGASGVVAATDQKALVEKGELIIVEGLAGTGKTVLLSHLFLRIANELGDDEHPPRANLLINHDEQLTVYNQIMLRLGLQNKTGQVVMKPVAFINDHSESGHGRGLDRQEFPTDPVDVALIDEAHLLLNQGNQGYRGSRNMLVDVMRRARVVIAVYDLEQVLRKSQELAPDMQKALFPEHRYEDGSAECARRGARLCDFDFNVTNLLLRQQFRIDACDEVVQWIDDFANGRGIGHIPRDPAREGHDPYEIRVFRSPFELRSAIQEKALTFSDKGELVDDERHGLSRVLATYDWPYSSKSRPESGAWEVQIYQEHNEWFAFADGDDSLPRDVRDEVAAGDTRDFFRMPWNYETDPADEREATGEKGKAWAEKPHTLNECGSIYTIQGFDLNFAGVIIGPSVCWRDGHVEFDPSRSKNRQAINGSDAPEENLRHELNVLLKRGVHGLYLFAVDHDLEEHLLRMQGA